MNRCPTARVEEVRKDRQMGRRRRRLREGESGSVKRGEREGNGVVQTCQGCHVMPEPDWAPAGGR